MLPLRIGKQQLGFASGFLSNQFSSNVSGGVTKSGSRCITTAIFNQVSSHRSNQKQYIMYPISKKCSNPVLKTNIFYRNYGRFEPDYLDPKGPQIAKYELINFQITGYDYTLLEEFAKFVHNSAERFGLDVEDAWGTPCKHLRVTRLKAESTIVEAEYKLAIYERNVQVMNAPCTVLPLFMDFVHTSLPGGVNLKVHPHFKEYAEVRYIPDLTLKEVRLQLQELGEERERKRK